MKKILILLASASVGLAQLPPVSNELFPQFRADLNTSLSNGVAITGSYTNPAWLVSIPAGKVTGLPAFPTGSIVGTSDTQALTNKTVNGISPTIFGYLGTISSDIQTQVNGKQAILGFTPLNSTSNLSDIGNAATARGNLGLGTASTQASSAFEPAITAGVTTQYFRGDKTMQSLSAAIWASITGTAPITFNSGTGAFGCQAASGTQAGCLSSSDWATFNGKQSALGFTAENSANKGAASGYAPLNSSTVVPLVNLPTIPYSQTTGVQASLGYTPLNAANNLSDLGTVATARTNLGLGAAALKGVSGTGANLAAVTGTLTSGHCIQFDASFNLIDSGTTNCGGGGSATWGSLTGTLSSQTDLQTALNGKQASLGFTAENAANKGAASGYAPLNGSSLVPLTNLPTIPTTQVSGLPTFPTGVIIGTTDTQSLTNKTVDGVTPATLAFMDATSSVQTQINGKAPSTSGSAPLKGNGSGGTSAAAAADIAGLFSGCSGVLYLGADGACHAPGGASANAAPAVVYTSSTVLTIGTGVAGLDATTYTFSATPTVTISSGTPTVRIYVSDGSDGASVGAIVVRNSAASGVACSSGCVVQNSQTTFPGQSIPLSQWTATSAGAWDAAPATADLRTSQSRTLPYSASTGISQAGKVFSVDTSVVPRKYSGSGAPGSVTTSTVGDIYADTTNGYTYQCFASPCTAVGAGNWVKVASTLAGPVAVTSSKTLALGDNYTTQDISGSSITISAPASVPGVTTGWAVPLVNQGTSTITISGNGALINGQSTQTLAACASTPTTGCPRKVLSVNAAGTGYDYGPPDSTGAVSSVDSKTGAVTLNATDIAGAENCVDSGAADAAVCAPTYAITSYSTGQTLRVKIAANNATTTPTIAVSGLAAKTITKNGGSALAAGDLVANRQYFLTYLSGGTFDISVSSGSGGATIASTSAVLKGDGAGNGIASTLTAPSQAGSPMVVLSSQVPSADTLTCSTITTTETAFATNYTIPANFFAAGKVLRVTIGSETTGTNTPTFKPSIRLGSTAGSITGTAVYAASPSASNTGTFEGGAVINLIGSAAPSSSSAVTTAVVGTVLPWRFGVTPTVNNLATNASLLLQVTFQCSNSTAGNSLTLTSLTVEGN